jgi:hypothetical protein
MSKDNLKQLMIIGGGLAGCEAAWQAAIRGVTVTLFEMRPKKMTEAHTSGLLAELVCSNSLGSKVRNRATGLLKEECSLLGSLLIDCAEQNALPAGDALAVDRSLFAEAVTRKIESHPNITINRQEITEIPSGQSSSRAGRLLPPPWLNPYSKSPRQGNYSFLTPSLPSSQQNPSTWISLSELHDTNMKTILTAIILIAPFQKSNTMPSSKPCF